MSDKAKKKTHKFDVWDICQTCGVERKKVPFSGTGFNPRYTNSFHWEYSSDGTKFSKEFINCKKK